MVVVAKEETERIMRIESDIQTRKLCVLLLKAYLLIAVDSFVVKCPMYCLFLASEISVWQFTTRVKLGVLHARVIGHLSERGSVRCNQAVQSHQSRIHLHQARLPNFKRNKHHTEVSQTINKISNSQCDRSVKTCRSLEYLDTPHTASSQAQY
jgi:hypothetical protein